mmetsp:Transcript_62563/g.146773  ORF Transcript_62563/g.146773 Transcript_62563/m.146773 type:complete len:214 (-) Transcript_62563:2222-2863(-)
MPLGPSGIGNPCTEPTQTLVAVVAWCKAACLHCWSFMVLCHWSDGLLVARLPNDVEEIDQLHTDEGHNTSGNDTGCQHVLPVDRDSDGNEVLISLKSGLAVILLALLQSKASTGGHFDDLADALGRAQLLIHPGNQRAEARMGRIGEDECGVFSQAFMLRLALTRCTVGGTDVKNLRWLAACLVCPAREAFHLGVNLRMCAIVAPSPTRFASL